MISYIVSQHTDQHSNQQQFYKEEENKCDGATEREANRKTYTNLVHDIRVSPNTINFNIIEK